MANLSLYVGQHLAGIGLIPAPIKLLGSDTELDNQIARQILGLDLAPLFPPKAKEGRLIVAHDDPGVRAAYKVAAV
jgi:hypothetical protein